MIKRSLESYIYDDLAEKIALIMGPRQCGKTTLAKGLCANYDYYNYDSMEDRKLLHEQGWDRQKELIIFDELHKMSQWKRWLKGIYDTEGIPPKLLVTGSAKLNTFKRVGDSLAGRYFHYHLHPLDLKELMMMAPDHADNLFEQLWNCSGFPEPFFKGSETYYKRWRSTHIDIIMRQDLIDLYTVQDLKAVETLVLLLKSRVGSSVSYANLARDLQKDISTIQRWLIMLEDLHIIYRITPYSQKISRSLLKEPKFYFYDHNYIDDDPGAKLENMVANALLKELHFLQDTQGTKGALHYLRTKDGKEIDFLVCIEGKPTHMIEVKTNDDSPAKSFHHFAKYLPSTKQLQLVKNISREKTYPTGLEIRKLITWLSTIHLA